MNEHETILVGKIGLAISIVLWLLCTWRLVFHSCWGECFGLGRAVGRDGEEDERRRYHSLSQVSVLPTGTEHQQQQQGQRYACAVPFFRRITRRRAFHGLLWIATLCDVLSYADLSGILPFTSDRILAENIGYILLNVVGRTFELIAFCIVTEIWLRTAIDARPRSMHSGMASTNVWLHWSTYVFVFVTALVVLASVSLSVVMFCRFPHAPNREYVLTMQLSMLQTLLEAAFWGIHVGMVALSIDMTSRCVLILVPATEWKRRLYLLSKAVGPMVVSCLAYATRCGWLIAAYINQNRRDSWAWWISFAWIPTASVSIVLLYSTRKRDYNDVEGISTTTTTEDNADASNVYGNSDDNLQQSLLRPQPPEEAFRAFHSFRRGEEDADDSFSLGSPVPRNVSETAVGQETVGQEP